VRYYLLVSLAALAVSGPLMAQQLEIAPPPVTEVAQPAPTILLRDTPIEMMATSEIRSDNAPAGTRFKLRVNKPVIINGQTVVPVGSWAHAEVTAAKSSGGLGHSGTMSTKLLYLQVGDVQIPLEGESSTKGTGAGSAGIALIFTWAGLFHRGNNAKIKAGEIVSGFVGEDVALDLTAQPIRRVSVVATAAQPQ
jgi:hypothetical protein